MRLCRTSARILVSSVKDLFVLFSVFTYCCVFNTESMAIKTWNGALHFTPGMLAQVKQEKVTILLKQANKVVLFDFFCRCLCLANSFNANGALLSKLSYHSKSDACVDIVRMVCLADER